MPNLTLSAPLLTAVETVRICAPTIVEASVGRVRREVCDRRLEEWSETALRLARVEVEVSGLEHVRHDRTYLVMTNHQSTYDIFVMIHVFPQTLRMVSKIEMFRIPVLGPAMAAAEFVPLDRGDHGKAREGLEYAKAKIASGVNVWISPEGTRSPTGHLLPFKKGGFMMALQSGAPILPATIVGTRDVLASKASRVALGRSVSVQFHPEIDPNEYGLERREALIDAVRDRIDSGLPSPMRVART